MKYKISFLAFIVLSISQTECMNRNNNNSFKAPNNSNIAKTLPAPVRFENVMRGDGRYTQNGNNKTPIQKDKIGKK